MAHIVNKDAKDSTMDGCLSMETLQMLPPCSRESRSRTCGMLFQLSPRAGLEIPPSPPTVWLVTFKNPIAVLFQGMLDPAKSIIESIGN